jgi:hypothetical protein
MPWDIAPMRIGRAWAAETENAIIATVTRPGTAIDFVKRFIAPLS